MNESNKKILGILPNFRGNYDPTISYNYLNEVFYGGSTFRSKVDNNTNPPCKFNPDGTYEIHYNWQPVAIGSIVPLDNERLDLVAAEAKRLNDILTTEFNNVDNTTDLDKPISTATKVALDSKVDKSLIGSRNGLATLDSSGVVPTSQLNPAIISGKSYKGSWDASTNTPNLTSVPASGFYYIVSKAGNRFNIDWNVDDTIISNGTAWEKITSTASILDSKMVQLEQETNDNMTLRALGISIADDLRKSHKIIKAKILTTGEIEPDDNFLTICDIRVDYGDIIQVDYTNGNSACSNAINYYNANGEVISTLYCNLESNGSHAISIVPHGARRASYTYKSYCQGNTVVKSIHINRDIDGYDTMSVMRDNLYKGIKDVAVIATGYDTYSGYCESSSIISCKDKGTLTILNMPVVTNTRYVCFLDNTKTIVRYVIIQPDALDIEIDILKNEEYVIVGIARNEQSIVDCSAVNISFDTAYDADGAIYNINGYNIASSNNNNYTGNRLITKLCRGGYVSPDGSGAIIDDPSGDYMVSNKIVVSPNELIVIKGFKAAERFRYIVFKDKYNNVISANDCVPFNVDRYYVRVPKGATYMQATIKVYTEINDINNVYVGYYTLASNNKLKSYNSDSNRFLGAIIGVIGDSITTQSDNINQDTGEYVVNITNWTTYASTILGCKLINYATSGARFTSNQSLSFWQQSKNQIDKLVQFNSRLDSLIISLSTNDMSNMVTLGDYSSAMSKDIANLDLTIYADAIRYVLYNARKIYGDIPIYVCTALQVADYDTVINDRLPYYEVLIKISERYGCRIIDQRKAIPIVSDFEKKSSNGRYLIDGLHTNDIGKIVQAENIALIMGTI